MGHGVRPEQETGLQRAPGGQLQTSQAGEARVVVPGQYGATADIAQHLFAGPQGFLRRAGAYQHDPFH